MAADEQRPPGQNPNPAALVALAWVHLQRHEPQEMHSCLKRADAALGVSPDKLIGAAGCLVAAGAALADGHAEAAAHIITRARSGWPVPAWLDQQLNLVESRACAAAGDTQAALTAAERAGRRHLAGGRGHLRARHGGRRGPRERTARARGLGRGG